MTEGSKDLLRRLKKVKNEPGTAAGQARLEDFIADWGKYKGQGKTFKQMWEGEQEYVEWFLLHVKRPTDLQMKFSEYLAIMIENEEEADRNGQQGTEFHKKKTTEERLVEKKNTKAKVRVERPENDAQQEEDFAVMEVMSAVEVETLRDIKRHHMAQMMSLTTEVQRLSSRTAAVEQGM